MVELAVGSLTYTSSDESDFSEDENGERYLTGYLLKLPWERSRMTKAKKAFDDVYIRSLNPRARVNLVSRRAHARPSARCRPIGGLEWAVRSEEAVHTPSSPLLATTNPSPGTQPTITTTPSHRACPTSVRPPTPPHPPSARTSPTTMATLSLSIHPSTSVTPLTCTNSSMMAIPSRGSRRTTVASTKRTHNPVLATPSSSTQPSTTAPSLMLGSSLTPRTSKRKKPNSKKDSARRRSRAVSPLY